MGKEGCLSQTKGIRFWLWICLILAFSAAGAFISASIINGVIWIFTLAAIVAAIGLLNLMVIWYILRFLIFVPGLKRCVNFQNTDDLCADRWNGLIAISGTCSTTVNWVIALGVIAVANSQFWIIGIAPNIAAAVASLLLASRLGTFLARLAGLKNFCFHR